MLKKIKKIKKLLIFNDYSWDNNLPEFKQYNLIYGWNGSGKTTLTYLFAALEKGTSEKYQDLEYEIETESGSIKQGEAFLRKVRVFNEDYISDNVKLLQGKAKSINIILGKENKKITEEIQRDESLLLEKKTTLKKAIDDKETLINQKNSKFTDTATLISSMASGRAARDYNKRNAEAAFQQLSDKEVLEGPDIQKHRLTLQQQIKETLQELLVPKLTYQEKEEELDLSDLLKNVIIKGKDLCAQTVDSIIIDRLKENSDISEWVEIGILLHKKHKSEVCEYCGQVIPEKRLKELVSYFNEADKNLKDSIDVLIKILEEASAAIKNIEARDKANLYEEIQLVYQSTVDTLVKEKKIVLEKVDSLCELLKGKKSKTTESVKLEINIDTNPFITAIEQVNVEIRKHNTKTTNFQNEKDLAQKQLEKHYLSTIFDEVKDLAKEIDENDNLIQILENGDPANPNEFGISELGTKIDENKAKISSSHKACEEINESLRTFLGRDEITFEVAGEGKEGYVIKRNGEIAYNLSEGEQNAIAFVYFVVHLQDQDFDIKEGVVIIDDPVSSLDSSSLFQAFSVLKNAVINAHQAFLFTHNFDFLRLLLSWLKYRGYQNCRSYYMLINRYIDGDRHVEISKLDQLLQDHESEYHYLFKQLYNFINDGSIESVYNVPNLARKLLDTFLMFRVPNNKSIYEKLKELDFDEKKKTAIYQFTNVQSHITGKGFDPSLVQETQKNVEYLREMMREVFPEHYRILVESINN